MFTRLLLLCMLLGAMANAMVAQAHESRPAYLEINETAPGRYEVLWRTPINAGMRLPVVLKFPDDTRNSIAPSVKEFTGQLLERRLVDAGKTGLAGKRIEFVGLQATITDVLVRVQALDGTHTITLVHPSQPWVEIAASQGIADVAGAYLVQGIEHILFGTDHLLFVLGLMLMVRDRWMLLKTITAFTVAHSITLAAATLGYVHVPAPPLNAGIALSIMFVGVEVLRSWRGEMSLTLRQPWLVAFAFGLVHGLGFASGLASLGLPQGDIPVALLLFNVGVEIGQLSFVALTLLLLRSFHQLEISLAAAGAHDAGLCCRLSGRVLDDRPDRRHDCRNRMMPMLRGLLAFLTRHGEYRWIVYARVDHPSMRSPIAAIQLPDMRTASRAHCARSDVTCPARSDTIAARQHAVPAIATRPLGLAAKSTPLASPCSVPTVAARPITAAKGSRTSAATATPASAVAAALAHEGTTGRASAHPADIAIIQAAGSVASSQRP